MLIRKTIFILFFISAFIYQAQGQDGDIPSVDIKTVYGERFNTDDIDNDGNPIILSFWATWCKPCLNELNAINEVYYDWQDETGVKVVTVSIDNSRSTSKVLPLVNGNSWDYEVYLDANGDFKRAMGVNMIPHTFLLNGDKEVVWQHTSYSEGGEYEMYEKIKKVAAGEPIE